MRDKRSCLMNLLLGKTSNAMMRSISRENSLKVSLLSFVAAILVVSIHVPSTREQGFSMLFENFIGTYIASAAVPFFFIVSAFFLESHIAGGGYRVEVKKRIRTLLVPYLFWCMAFSLQQNLNSLASNLACNYPLGRHIDFNPVNMFGLDLRRNPPLPLWFIRALMLYVIAYPLFRAVARNKAIVTVGALSLCTLACIKKFVIPAELNVLFSFTFAPMNLLAFLVGIWLAGHPVRLHKRIGVCLFSTSIAVLAVLSFHSGIPHVVKVLLQIMATVSILSGAWSICPSLKLPKVLKNQSFPIYLLHAAFVPYVLLLAQKLKFMVSWYGYVANVILLVAGSVVSSYLLRRYIPKFSKMVFGGR